VLVEAQPFIPYVREENFASRLRPVVEPYRKRMGFLPNALKLYAHRPEIAETLWRLNDNIMHDDAAMKQVKRAGGEVLGEPMMIPGVGRYVSFFDSERNRVSMLEPVPRP
jgi:hypothetical protein